MDLVHAQLTALQAGFTNIGVVDASGQRRSVDDGETWTVCRQSQPPGSVATATGPPVTMYANHTTEGC
jgi:hypothetical protein